MKLSLKIALAVYFAFQIYLVTVMAATAMSVTPWIAVRPLAIAVCAIQYFRGRTSWGLWLSIVAGGGLVRMLITPPTHVAAYIEGITQLLLCVMAFLVWRSESKQSAIPVFDPDFPIIPLFSGESEALERLGRHGDVSVQDPGTDKAIAQKLLVAETAETRISVGIWDGRVRFTNYLTSHFNESDQLKGAKLKWFVNYYGGRREFNKPMDTGYMIFWRNPQKKIMIVFGLHMGPVRIIDEDPAHWTDENKPAAPA